MRTSTAHPVLVLLLALAIVTSSALVPALASAQVERSILDQQATNGRFSVGPDRTEIDVAPGSVTRFPMTLTNYIDRDVRIKVSPVNLAPAEDPSQLVTISRQSEFGAGSWLSVDPGLKGGTTVMKPREQLRLEITVRTPPDAPAGTNFAGITVEVQPINGPGSPGSNSVGFRFQGLSQVYINVAGPVTRDLKVVKTRIGDSFVFGGRRLVTYEIEIRNNGTVNDHLSGKMVIRSLFGNTAKVLPIPRDLLILRGSTRTWRLVWDGTPRFGRFTASGDFHSDSKDLKPSFPSVLIMPPWWWIAIVLGALAIPIAKRLYDHFFGWRRYLDDTWDEDEDWDEEWDDMPSW